LNPNPLAEGSCVKSKLTTLDNSLSLIGDENKNTEQFLYLGELSTVKFRRKSAIETTSKVDRVGFEVADRIVPTGTIARSP
jgi:hypothetical protein